MIRPHLKVTIAVLIAEVLAMIEITMIYAALRVLVEEFGSPEAVSWAITGFLLVSALSAVLFGRLGDLFNRKQLLLLVIALSIIGSLTAGFSSTLFGFVVGRCIQGAAGGIFPLCIGILRENIDINKLPVFIGFLSGIMTVSAGAGMYIGGLVVDYLTWHWIFFVTALIGVVAWVAIYFVVPAGTDTSTGRSPGSGINYLGGLLFAPGIALVLLSFTKMKDWGVTDPSALSLLGGGVLLVLLWLRSELKADKPLLNIRLLCNRDILLAVSASCLFGLSWMQFGQTWSLLLQQPTETGAGLGLSASSAGLLMQPQTLMALVGGPIAGWALVRYGARLSVILGSLMLGSCWVVALVKHDTVWMVVLLMLVMGFSSSFLVTLKVSIVARAAPVHQTGEAMGMLTLIRSIFNSIGALIVFQLLSLSTVPGIGGRGQFPSPFAYNVTMTYMAVGCFLIGAVYMVAGARRSTVEVDAALAASQGGSELAKRPQ